MLPDTAYVCSKSFSENVGVCNEVQIVPGVVVSVRELLSPN